MIKIVVALWRSTYKNGLGLGLWIVTDQRTEAVINLILKSRSCNIPILRIRVQNWLPPFILPNAEHAHASFFKMQANKLDVN